jgi:hypothetical protein
VSRRPRQNPLDEVASKLAALEAIMDVLRTHGVIRTRTVKAKKARSNGSREKWVGPTLGGNPVEETFA